MDQLKKFKARKRMNLPMFPYTLERELPDEDIVHISAYLASIKLDTTYPRIQGNRRCPHPFAGGGKSAEHSPLGGRCRGRGEALQDRVRFLPRRKGLGRRGVPMLAGQYTIYLNRQVDKFIKGERIHDEEMKDPSKDVLNLLKPEEIRDILAYLTTLDD